MYRRRSVMKQTLRLICVLAVAIGLSHVASAGGGKTKTTEEVAKTPEQEAVMAYNNGIAARDKAWKIEKKLHGATDAREQEKLTAKREKTYRAAVENFERAVRKK